MELRQLEYFLAVADELHFTRAAARLHVVQSTLSTSVAGLERELGTELFVRDRRSIALTEAGRALVPAARRAVAAAADIPQAVHGRAGDVRGHLRVGSVQVLGRTDLADLLAAMVARHPHVTLSVGSDAAPALVYAAASGELDIAFVDGPVDNPRAVVHPIETDRLVLAVARDDPLARRTSIRLADRALARRAFVEYRRDSRLRAQVDAACSAVGLVRRSTCEVAILPALVELVARGTGVAIVPPSALTRYGDSVAPVRLLGDGLTREIVAVTSRRPPTRAVQALLDLLPTG